MLRHLEEQLMPQVRCCRHQALIRIFRTALARADEEAVHWNSDQLSPAETVSASDLMSMHALAEYREIVPALMRSDFPPSEGTWSGEVTVVAVRELH